MHTHSHTQTLKHRKTCVHIVMPKYKRQFNLCRSRSVLYFTYRNFHRDESRLSLANPRTQSCSLLVRLTLTVTPTLTLINSVRHTKHFNTPNLFICVIFYEACPHPQHVRSLTDCARLQMISQ